MVDAILVTIAIVAVVLLAILYYLGIFIKVKVEVRKPPFGDCIFLYKFHRGPYNQCGKAYDELSKLKSKFPCAGIYFDDPDVVSKLNSHPFRQASSTFSMAIRPPSSRRVLL